MSGKVAHRAPHPNAYAKGRARRRRRGAFPIVMLTIAIVALLGGVALVVGGDAGEPGGQVTAPVTVTGAPLPPFDREASSDPAVGMKVPAFRGEGFDGSTVTIAPDGEPYAIVLLAHWCAHCQAEVKDFSAWLKTHGLPAQVFSVSTLVNERLANYPPDAWLSSEGWPLPVMVDDTRSVVSEVLGLKGTPMWVFVGRDGKVAGRLDGEVGPERVSQILGALV